MTLRRLAVLEGYIDRQSEVDDAYEQVVNLITHELVNKIGTKRDIRSVKQKGYIPKPWWSGEIQRLWNELVQAEKLYLTCKGNANKKRELRRLYKLSQKSFDKEYSRAKQKFKRNQAIHIENIIKTIQKNFGRLKTMRL